MPKQEGRLTGEMGVITNIADPLRPQNWLRGGNNVNVIRSHLLTSRYNGWLEQREDVFNSGGEFKDFSIFVDTDGDRTLLFQVGDELQSYDLVAQTETVIASGLDSSRPPCMRMFQPYADAEGYMIYCNGVDEPQKVTGTGVGDITDLQLDPGSGAVNYPVTLEAPLPAVVLSKPKFVEPFLDRVVLTGFDGNAAFLVALTNSTEAEVLTQSAPLVATDGGLFQVDPQLGAITAAKAFKLSNQDNEQVVLIGQTHGVSILIGHDAEDFQLFTLTSEFGIPSNRAFIQIGGEIYFLADDGIRRFSTLVANANLINFTMSYPVQDLVQRFNDGALKEAHAVHHRGYQEIQFWYPSDSDTQCKNALVFSYNTDPINPQPAPNPAIFTKTDTSVACSIYFDKTFYGGGYDGILQKHHAANTYNGTPINWSIDLAQAQPETFGALCELSRARVVMVGGDQKFLIQAAYYARTGFTDEGGFIVKRLIAKPEDKELISSSGGGTVLDSWRLGIDSFPGEHMRYCDFRPVGKGIAWEISLRGTQADHQIDFLGLDYILDVENDSE